MEPVELISEIMGVFGLKNDALELINGDNCAVYFHDDCVQHNIDDHIERPDRVRWIMKALREKFPPPVFREATLVTDDQIRLFHTFDHLQKFKELSARSEENKTEEIIDGDTEIMENTRCAAYRAAGSLISAIDDLCLPRNHPRCIRSAFCCVRPPGHHAERNRSCGFCFFNNAGIGARYAQDKYGIKRVAVLDFDVHHGNGTEDGFRNDPTLFYGSTHERDNYPGSGPEPRLKGKQATELWQRRIVNRTLDTGPASRQQFIKKWKEIVNEMLLFEPELVIFSAGFDAHKNDPLGGAKLETEDFIYATNIVLEACDALSDRFGGKYVPCISVLEGGYNLGAISKSSLVHVQSLFSPRATWQLDNVGVTYDGCVDEKEEAVQVLVDISSLAIDEKVEICNDDLNEEKKVKEVIEECDGDDDALVGKDATKECEDKEGSTGS